MQLITESKNIEDYLSEIPPIVVFDTPLVKEKLNWIRTQTSDKTEQAKLAFEIARDEIKHSFDLKSDIVTINAENVLEQCEGICFAKSHLLATLLRALGIPAGFCYQRVLKNPKDRNSGFALHGLNAVYLDNVGWFRLDPRGNKLGVDSQFSIKEEKLAYPIRTEWGEVDYPNVFVRPSEAVIQSMHQAHDFDTLFNGRPGKLFL
ncbi:MAG: transglutaminase family protein [Chitinophagales bacterium]|nr:transglutaminase family protein [Chitinophagales bacterium]